MCEACIRKMEILSLQFLYAYTCILICEQDVMHTHVSSLCFAFFDFEKDHNLLSLLHMYHVN